MNKLLFFVFVLSQITLIKVWAQTEEFEVSKDMFEIDLSKGHRINLSFGLLFGAGNTEFSYDITTPAPGLEASGVISRKFSAAYTNVQLPIAVSYSYKGISLGMKYNLTSTRATDRLVVYTFDDGTVSGGFDKGLQNWFQGRTYYGPFIEYDIKISEKFYISPSYSYLWYSLGKKGNTFFKSEQFANALDYNDAFINRNSNSFGLKFKFVVNAKSLINITLSHYIDSMEFSSDYLKEEIANYDHQTNNSYIGLSYQISL